MRTAFLVLCLVLSLAACKDETISPRIDNARLGPDDSGRYVFVADVNLPNEVVISTCLMRKDQDTWTCIASDTSLSPDNLYGDIRDGRYISWFPYITSEGLKAGTYMVKGGTIPSQPSNALGEKNKRLKGDGVSQSGVFKVWQFSTSAFELPNIAPQAPEKAVTPPPHDVPSQPKPSIASVMERYNTMAKVLEIPTVKPSAAVQEKAKKGDKIVATKVKLNNSDEVSLFQPVAKVGNTKPIESAIFVIGTGGEKGALTFSALLMALYQNANEDKIAEIMNVLSEIKGAGKYEDENVSISAIEGKGGVVILFGFKK